MDRKRGETWGLAEGEGIGGGGEGRGGGGEGGGGADEGDVKWIEKADIENEAFVTMHCVAETHKAVF